MSMIQIDPALPVAVDISGEGKWKNAIAHFLIDYTIEDDLYFVVFLDEGGSCWILKNKFVRLQRNISFGRTKDESRST